MQNNWDVLVPVFHGRVVAVDMKKRRPFTSIHAVVNGCLIIPHFNIMSHVPSFITVGITLTSLETYFTWNTGAQSYYWRLHDSGHAIPRTILVSFYVSLRLLLHIVRRRFEILRAMGPDEFHEQYPTKETAGLNNNAYTNVMVVWCLTKALHVLNHVLKESRRKELIASLHLSSTELNRWVDITQRMYVPILPDGIIEQFEGWNDLKELDWKHYREKYGNIGRLGTVIVRS